MLQIFEPLEGAKVLDLFSGSGVLGIEALSRGASRLVSIEKNRRIFSSLSKNLKSICKDEEKFEALCLDVFYYIKKSKEKFDVIICDPPYNQYDYMELFRLSSKLLDVDGIFCMEMRKSHINTDIFEIRTYGSTQIILWRNNG